MLPHNVSCDISAEVGECHNAAVLIHAEDMPNGSCGALVWRGCNVSTNITCGAIGGERNARDCFNEITADRGHSSSPDRVRHPDGRKVEVWRAPRAQLEQLATRGEVQLQLVEEELNQVMQDVERAEKYFGYCGLGTESQGKDYARLFTTVAEILSAVRSAWDEVHREARFAQYLPGASLCGAKSGLLGAPGSAASEVLNSARDRRRQQPTLTPRTLGRRSSWTAGESFALRS